MKITAGALAAVNSSRAGSSGRGGSFCEPSDEIWMAPAFSQAGRPSGKRSSMTHCLKGSLTTGQASAHPNTCRSIYLMVVEKKSRPQLVRR